MCFYVFQNWQRTDQEWSGGPDWVHGPPVENPWHKPLLAHSCQRGRKWGENEKWLRHFMRVLQVCIGVNWTLITKKIPHTYLLFNIWSWCRPCLLRDASARHTITHLKWSWGVWISAHLNLVKLYTIRENAHLQHSLNFLRSAIWSTAGIFERQGLMMHAWN